MAPVALSLMWSAALLILFAVSHVRLQCDSGALFMAQCSGVDQRRLFLLYESAATETVECSSTDSGNSYRWTLSPDGTEGASMNLDTSSSDKYTVDGRSLSITLSNITGEDGGLYRCVYVTDGGFTEELCIEVYERAVFESCPSEYNGCTRITSLSVTAGGSAVFDASVVYTPGGSCDFQQVLTRVKLLRINNEFGASNDLLFSCSTTEGAECTINDNRVSLNRGNKPGLEFRFTLDGAQMSDNSSYRVIVVGTHPGTGVETRLIKNFSLQVDPAPIFAPTIPGTSVFESTTSLSNDNPPTFAPTIPGTSVFESTTSLSNDIPVGAASGGNSGAVAAGVSVSLSVVLLVVIVLGLLFLIVRWKRGSVPSPNKSSGVREDGTKVNSDEAEIDSRSRGNSITVTTKSHTEVQPLGNGQSVYVDVNNSIVVSLPPPNTRSSIVDADMHELPSRLQEPPNLPLRAQSAAARTLESNDVTV